jgi:hypothetical protein
VHEVDARQHVEEGAVGVAGEKDAQVRELPPGRELAGGKGEPRQPGEAERALGGGEVPRLQGAAGALDLSLRIQVKITISGRLMTIMFPLSPPFMI